MFFSRRIGINNSREVPIVGGARVTGRVGAYSIGALNLQAGESAAASALPTNFTVVRIKRDVFQRSNIGAIYTRRVETEGGAPAGDTFGVDALYSISRSLNITGYLARTRKEGRIGKDVSALARFDQSSDRYGLRFEHLSVGANFNPEVGFLRRSDFRREFAMGRFSPRPARTHMKAVRQFNYQSSLEYIENTAGRREWREGRGSLAIDFQNGDSLSAGVVDDYEFVPREFAIATGVNVLVGGYTYRTAQLSYMLGTQHTVAGTMSYQQGSFYGGSRKTLGLSSGRVEITPQLAIEPSLSTNWVELPSGDFTSAVVSVRNTYMFSPRVIVSALLQYNSGTKVVSTNARLYWEYHPGSYLFVVYNDGRDTAQQGYPNLLNRAFIVKINRLLRF
jgi:hypothetical protein